MAFNAAVNNNMESWLNDRTARMTEAVWHLLSFISYTDAEGRDRRRMSMAGGERGLCEKSNDASCYPQLPSNNMHNKNLEPEPEDETSLEKVEQEVVIKNITSPIPGRGAVGGMQ